MSHSEGEDYEKTAKVLPEQQSNEILRQATSTCPTLTPAQAEAPPDGGKVAWFQVLASFWLWFNSLGLANAFGVFVGYYQIKFPDVEPSIISLVGSINAFVILFFGFFAGPLWDAGYGRTLVLAGVCISSFGYFMVSISNAYWQVMLAQGVVAGFGACLVWVPAIAIIPQYFNRHKALANGIACSGSSIGGVIYPIAFRQLLRHLSFGWSVRILAFMILTTGIMAFTLMRIRSLPTTKRRLTFDYRSFFAEPAYGLYTLVLILTMAAQYMPPWFIQDFATAKTNMSEDLANYILPILNATSVIGRILPNIISDHVGGINVLIPFMFAATVLTFAWIGIHSTAGCIIFAMLFGLCIGCILSLPPFVVASLCPDPKVQGTKMGNAFSVGSFGLLLGPPVAGAILQRGNWLGLQLYSAAMLAAVTAGLLVVRVRIAGWALNRRI